MVNALFSQNINLDKVTADITIEKKCTATLTLKETMDKAIEDAIATEIASYGVNNEQELSLKCEQFKKVINENDALVQVGNHTYSWLIKSIEIDEKSSLSGKELGEALINSVNNYGFKDNGFAVEIARSHRTLQQSAMRIMMAAIRELANNSTDARNESTVALAKAICNLPEARRGLYLI